MAAVKGCDRVWPVSRTSSLTEILFFFLRLVCGHDWQKVVAFPPRLDPEAVIHMWKRIRPLPAAYCSHADPVSITSLVSLGLLFCSHLEDHSETQ